MVSKVNPMERQLMRDTVLTSFLLATVARNRAVTIGYAGQPRNHLLIAE